jgi:hypothetical protein
MPYTLTERVLLKPTVTLGAEMYPPVHDEHWRPLTRQDCADVPRPCPFVGCHHNMYCDVSPRTGSVKINHAEGVQPWHVDPKQSCVLDIVEREGAMTLESIGVALGGLVKERARQISDKAQ